MKNMIKVSIVVPIYNKGKYLQACINSILNQTFSDYELICINDHSTDDCLEIINSMMKEDERIKLINHTENKGAAWSRNEGILSAVGEYLLILDADDLFDNRLIELAYNECVQNKLDVLIYNYCRFDSTSQKIFYNNKTAMTIKRRLHSAIFSKTDITDFAFQLTAAGAPIKMIKKNLILQHNIFFQNITNSNDVYFGKMVLLEADRMGYLDKVLLKYRSNTSESISGKTSVLVSNFVKAAGYIKAEMLSRGIYERNKRSFYTYVYKTICMHFGRTGSEMRNCVWNQEIENIRTLLNDGDRCFLNYYYEYWFRDFAQYPPKKHAELRIDNEYWYMLKYETARVQKILSYIRRNQFKVAQWGYGREGMKFVKIWRDEMGYPMDAIVDSDIEVIEREESVFDKDIIKNGKYFILVITAGFVEDILEQVQSISAEAQVFDIQSYLAWGFTFEECTFR